MMFEEETKNTFFIYDTTAMQNEYSTLEDAVVFYWPKLSENTNELFLLFGQLVGMVLFTESLTDAMPTTVNLKKTKYAVQRSSHYLLVLGHSTLSERVPDSYLQGKLQKFVELFTFYHGSIDRLYKSCSYNKKEFLLDLDLICTYYLGYAQGCGSVIDCILDPLPVVTFNKASSTIFMKVNHILQLCQRKENVLCGCLISESTVISSQIPKELVNNLLLLKPNKKNHTASLFYPGFDWPFGVKIFKVYCTSQQHEEILKIAKLSPYFKKGEAEDESTRQNTRRKHIKKLKSASEFSKPPCVNGRKVSAGDYHADYTSFSKSFDSNDTLSKFTVIKDHESTFDESAQAPSTINSCSMSQDELVELDETSNCVNAKEKCPAIVSSSQNDPQQVEASVSGYNGSYNKSLSRQSEKTTKVEKYIMVGENALVGDVGVASNDVSSTLSNVPDDNSETKEMHCSIATDAQKGQSSVVSCDDESEVNYDCEPIFAHIVTSTPQKNPKPREEVEDVEEVNYDTQPVHMSIQFNTKEKQRENSIGKISNTRDLPKFYMSAKMSSDMNSDQVPMSTSLKKQDDEKKAGNEEVNAHVDDGMTELHLYVQAHSSTTLMLLMTSQESYDKNSFKSLCETVLPQLGDIEAQIKSLINSNHLKMNKEKENIRYLKYCKITNTYRGNLLDSVTAHDRIFLETVNMVHHQFNNAPSCSDVTFRTSQTSMYAHQSQNEEVYYQVRGNYKPVQGAPSNIDVAWSLDQRVNAKLKKMTNTNFVF